MQSIEMEAWDHGVESVIYQYRRQTTWRKPANRKAYWDGILSGLEIITPRQRQRVWPIS